MPSRQQQPGDYVTTQQCEDRHSESRRSIKNQWGALAVMASLTVALLGGLFIALGASYKASSAADKATSAAERVQLRSEGVISGVEAKFTGAIEVMNVKYSSELESVRRELVALRNQHEKESEQLMNEIHRLRVLIESRVPSAEAK